ncbi:unnamed protein product [Ixodes persulcatus]
MATGNFALTDLMLLADVATTQAEQERPRSGLAELTAALSQDTPTVSPVVSMPQSTEMSRESTALVAAFAHAYTEHAEGNAATQNAHPYSGAGVQRTQRSSYERDRLLAGNPAISEGYRPDREGDARQGSAGGSRRPDGQVSSPCGRVSRNTRRVHGPLPTRVLAGRLPAKNAQGTGGKNAGSR